MNKYLLWILFFIGLFGCKEKKKFNPTSLENISIDSMVIYYTQNKLSDDVDFSRKDTIFSKRSIDSIKYLSYFLHGTNMNFYQNNFFSVVLADSVLIKDSSLINQLKNTFYNRNKNEALQNPTACLPDYRDLIIFYSKGKRIGGIKICFTCGYIQFSPLELDDDFDVTENSFTELENYFNKNIHKVN